MSVEEPPKFVKNASGVKGLNPAWKAWKAAQDGGAPAAAPAMSNEAVALPVVTSLAEQQKHLGDSKVADSVAMSVEMLNDEDVAKQVGCANPVEELSRIFAKYEVPLGLINKLMLMSDYQYIEMIVDDSGSMNAATDSKLPDGRPMTRWQEVYQRLTQMFEVLAFVPCPPAYVRFLNRTEVIECKKNPGETPQQYIARVLTMLGQQWQRPPSGTTPARERIAESLARCPGQSMLRYFFGDGEPNGGADAARAITQMLVTRPNPAQNPFTFMSCTNEDAAVEWMKDCEEAAPNCSEFDDYKDEQAEVVKDQGNAFPYTFGMHLIAQLVSAFSLDDLDAIDESVPMTRVTLSNLLGYELDAPSYKHYFDCFLAAQAAQPVETESDRLEKQYLSMWPANFQHFMVAPVAKDIQVVQQRKAALLDLKRRGL